MAQQRGYVYTVRFLVFYDVPNVPGLGTNEEIRKISVVATSGKEAIEEAIAALRNERRLTGNGNLIVVHNFDLVSLEQGTILGKSS